VPEELFGLNKELLDRLFEAAYIVDKDRRIIYWNPQAENLTGYKASEVTGSFCFDNLLLHIDESGCALCKGGCPLQKTLDAGHGHDEQLFLHHKLGHRVPVSIRIVPLQSMDNTIAGALELFVDRSPREEIAERIKELENLALLDPLTELANRRYIEISLEQRCIEVRRYKGSSGILYIDIDHFKQINDTYGHHVGDLVLKSVGRTLVENSRPFDLFGRLGGEEFVGIIRNITFEELTAIAEKFKMLLAGILVEVDSELVGITVSIGGTLILSADTAESLLRRADALMYQGKMRGRNRVVIG
jgi:diguanylate cyclase (GGDEF)-like protein/PAS domain S-box-containing protein